MLLLHLVIYLLITGYTSMRSYTLSSENIKHHNYYYCASLSCKFMECVPTVIIADIYSSSSYS